MVYLYNHWSFSSSILYLLYAYLAAFSSENRCSFYPRCLLFSCCDSNRDIATDRVDDFPCIANSSICTKSLASKIDNIKSFIYKGISLEDLSETFTKLPFTSGAVYGQLSKAKYFRVLYLVLATNDSCNIPAHYNQMQDLIFLSTFKNCSGNLLTSSMSDFSSLTSEKAASICAMQLPHKAD